ncbi:MFS transporter [Bdellovibrio sp. HCB337]|uniref:MFS transporter n=1 Tax=Bdellovibrio sp. HCB337 TaxID=3394358 RepID=UPI0039A705EF
MQASVWSPFRYPAYRVFWCCAFLSNLGTWVQDVAASWLMTHLSTSPLVISLLSFSSSLPVVLLSIPAGFWADSGDRRKILLFAQALMASSAFFLGLQAAQGTLSEIMILLLCFSMGIGVALNGPAYQTVLSELVPQHEQQSAVMLYYMGLNITRVVGPAVGGLILGFAGASSAFFVNAFSFLGLIFYYWIWPIGSKTTHAPEKFTAYYQKINSQDWKILFSIHNLKLWVEILAVSFSASALWALYPVRGRLELHLESLQYGSLLGCLGFGAFLSAIFSRHLMNPQRTWQSLSFAYLVFAAGETLLALADVYVMACLAMVLGGIGWIILATLMNMSTRQLSTASHLKATMLGVFLSVFYLGMSLGSVTWGALARFSTSSKALLVSAVFLSLCSVYKYVRKS